MPVREVPEKFLIAFSLAGEQRDLVRSIAEAVEAELGHGSVFFDEWFEPFLAGHDADLKLQKIYGEQSELVVVCVSGRYGGKPWTLAEHEAVRARLMQSRSSQEERDRLRILPIRVGEGEVAGIALATIVPDVRTRSVTETAELILSRLSIIVQKPAIENANVPVYREVASTPNEVFIAFKNLDEKGAPTRDAEIARDVYEFLTAKGLKVFFSAVTLEDLGTWAYKEAIDEALDSAKVVVAIGTSGIHLNSTWVRYEWDSFYNDILSGVKPNGKVFTYIEGMTTAALPRALRQTQTFLHSPESLQKLFNFINRTLSPYTKEHLEAERRQKGEQQRKREEDVLLQMPDEMPRGAVFVSYSRNDREAVATLVRGLRAAQIPVWVDKQRLSTGENYERSLKFEVRNACSFFVSVISRATESDSTRFVHTERSWAEQRHVDGFVYYIPIVIDDTEKPKLEPASFAKIRFDRLPNGMVTPAFASKLQKWVEEYRDSGQPRD